MKRSLEMAGGFLATQLNYIPALLVVFAVYYGILKQEPVLWKYALLAFVPFGFYIIRVYVKKLVLFFALHIGWAVLPLFLADNIAEMIFGILFGVVFGGVSIYFKVAKNQTEDSILFSAMTCIIAIISYFSTLSGGGENAAGKIAGMAIIYVVYYMIYQYITGYLNYIKNNEVSNQSIPKQHIFKTSASALVGFLSLFIGFALLLVKGNIFADFIYKIGDWIKRFIIWLLSFAPEAMEQGEAVEEATEAVENLDRFGENVEAVNKLPPEIVELIDKIVTVGAYIISGVAVLLFTYALFRAIVEAFKVKREVNEEEVVLVKEKVTRVKRGQQAKKEREKQFSKDKKIRKLYEDLIFKKTVTGTTDKIEKKQLLKKLKYQTPKEQCRYIKKKDIIHGLYEKARYSGNEITKEEVRLMKDACLTEGKNN